MQDFGAGKVARYEAGHPFPRPTAAAALAASPKRIQPETNDALDETVDLPRVERHGMIVQPALNNLAQPASGFAERAVHSLA
jgi:hypothetical protein